MRSDAGIKMSRADMKMYNLYKVFNRLMREGGAGSGCFIPDCYVGYKCSGGQESGVCEISVTIVKIKK